MAAIDKLEEMAEPKRKKATLNPPSDAYLSALRSELDVLYNDQNDGIQKIRDMREGTDPIAIPQELRLVNVEVRDPTVSDEISRVAATLSVNPIKFQVIPSSPSDKAQKNATKREKFTQEVIRIAGRRTPGIDTTVAAIDAAVGDGGGWTKFVLTKDLWERRYAIRPDDYEAEAAQDAAEWKEEEEHRTALNRMRPASDAIPGRPAPPSKEDRFNKATEEAKKVAGPPFTYVCCDAKAVYPVWRAGRLAEVLEVTQRPASSTFREYRLRRDDKGDIVPDELGQGNAGPSGGSANVEILEHWDEHFCTVRVGDVHGAGDGSHGRIVKQWRHRYGRPPYFFAPGQMLNYWRNRKIGWSIAEQKRQLVAYRSFLWTLHANAVARDTFAPQALEQDAQQGGPVGSSQPTGKPNEAPPTFKWGLREVAKLQAGQRIVPIQFPDVGTSIEKEIALVSQAIDALSTPRVNANIGAGMEGAGFAINQVLAEARIRHDPIAQNIERMLEEVAKFMWHLVRNVVKETVWVYADGKDGGWLSAGPDDLSDTVSIRAILDPERPSAKLIEERYWHERIDKGTASKDQAIEAFGDNPDEVRTGITLDRIRQTPWYISMQDKAVLEEVGMGNMIDEAEYLAQTGFFPGQTPPGMVYGPGGQPLPPQVPAMGGGAPGAVPDMGALSVKPGGGMMGASGPSNGSVLGSTPGMVVPSASAAPMAML